MTEFLSTLQTKDLITIAASAFALIVSILSYNQKAGESRLALRRQLTDLFEKLTDINTEFAMFQAKKDEYPSHYPGLLSDQRRFLVRQAAFIATKIRRMVSPFEYILLAGGHDEINDWSEAERYFQLAISTASNPVDRGIAIRGYGRFLFGHGRLDDARNQLSQALKCFEGTADRLLVFHADTLERWANHEREWDESQKADALLIQALKEYEQLENPQRRFYEVERVRAQMLIREPTEERTKKTDIAKK